MPFLILLLFIGLPIAEIAVLIKVADVIDLWPTILLIILTAVIGVYLLRLQGLSSIARAQSSLNEGRLPVNSITDAVGLLLAGAFLLTPGLITDTLGFALLIPAVRHGLAGLLFKKVQSSSGFKADIFGMDKDGNNPDPFNPGHSPSSPQGGTVIEGEVITPASKKQDKPEQNKQSDDQTPRKSSPWRP